MQILDQKLLLRITRNHQIHDNSSCQIFENSIASNYGWTYGKFEINASIEHNNAKAYIRLSPQRKIYGLEVRSGYIDIFTDDNRYLRQRSNKARLGIRVQYGDVFEEFHNLNKIELSRIKTGFHIFVFEWNKREMIWKIDENIVFNLSLDKYFSISLKQDKYAEKGQPSIMTSMFLSLINLLRMINLKI